MKSVVVTGGTKRLGAAISDGLERAGWRVLRSSHRRESGADIVADLSLEGGADLLFASASELLGCRPPDALVNNAALFTGDEDVLERVNYASPTRLMALMAATGGAGSVVNILDSRILSPGFHPTCMYDETKARLLAATLDAARDCADGLRVNAVAPGPVLAPESVREKASHCPLGRPTPAAVADAVCYLLSAEFTTGCVVAVDGGSSV